MVNAGVFRGVYSRMSDGAGRCSRLWIRDELCARADPAYGFKGSVIRDWAWRPFLLLRWHAPWWDDSARGGVEFEWEKRESGLEVVQPVHEFGASDRAVFEVTFLAWITTEGEGVRDYWGIGSLYCDKAWFAAFAVVIGGVSLHFGHVKSVSSGSA